jgi:hypothetical protein
MQKFEQLGLPPRSPASVADRHFDSIKIEVRALASLDISGLRRCTWAFIQLLQRDGASDMLSVCAYSRGRRSPPHSSLPSYRRHEPRKRTIWTPQRFCSSYCCLSAAVGTAEGGGTRLGFHLYRRHVGVCVIHAAGQKIRQPLSSIRASHRRQAAAAGCKTRAWCVTLIWCPTKKGRRQPGQWGHWRQSLSLHLPEGDRNQAEKRRPAIRLHTTLLARALVLCDGGF